MTENLEGQNEPLEFKVLELRPTGFLGMAWFHGETRPGEGTELEGILNGFGAAGWDIVQFLGFQVRESITKSSCAGGRGEAKRDRSFRVWFSDAFARWRTDLGLAFRQKSRFPGHLRFRARERLPHRGDGLFGLFEGLPDRPQ